MALDAASIRTRQIAWFDLILTAPFAIPFVSALYLALIGWLHGVAGFSPPLPPITPFHWLFVNVMGVLAITWAAARIAHPLPVLGRIDAIARAAVAALLVFWILEGATPVLGLFVITELAGTAYFFFNPRRA